MSGVESFSGFESQNLSGSAESLQAFKEKMAAAAAQLKTQQAQEQRQKQKEENLAKILSDFLKSGQDPILIHLITFLLSKNLPAIFILSLLFLNFPDLEKAASLQLLESSEATKTGATTVNALLASSSPTLPLEIKLAINTWLTNISQTIDQNRTRIIPNTLSPSNEIHPEIYELATQILSSYLQKNEIFEPLENLRKFVTFSINSFFKSTLKLG